MDQQTNIIQIAGGGNKTRSFERQYPIISCNLHYPHANFICAIDEPILDKLLYDNITGFNYQPVITNTKNKDRYADNARCFFYDYQKIHNTYSLSSGELAISYSVFFGFKTLRLSGFDRIRKEKLDNIITPYTIVTKWV